MRGALLTALAGCAAALVALVFPGGAFADQIAHVAFSESGEAIVNPYMGYAPWADSLAEEYVPEPDVSLAFALLSWREFEPQKGVYDFDSFEARNNLAHLRRHNVRLVIRVVCDYPGPAEHMDIPQWLYDETGGAGAFYRSGDLAGFAPDYENSYILERHALMIRALAERYDDPSVVAFIQLGSLGHWGEWHHSLMPVARFPGEEISEQYAGHYLDAFQRVKLQMRRPVKAVNTAGMGLYNDMMGHAQATNLWLDWIADSNMADFYLDAPSGGEFASTHALEDYFGPMYAGVKKMIVDSHATYIGCAAPKDGQRKENADDLLKTLGYRFTAVLASYTSDISEGGAVSIDLTIHNAGIAPFYYSWPLYYFFVDQSGGTAASFRSGRDVTDIVPNRLHGYTDVMAPDLAPGEYTIKLGLVNPDTGNAEVRFANLETDSDGLLIIGKVTVK